MANKLIQKNLINNAISAYYAAVELHNKPNFGYRYETVSILLINAWELILKAYVRKHIKGKQIYRKNKATRKRETLPLKMIVEYCKEYLNGIEPNNFFKATSQNILKIEEFRDNAIHFYNESAEPILFALIAKNAYDFPRFVKSYFGKDILLQDSVHIMPIGFKLPFNPTDYFKKNYSHPSKSQEVRDFVNSLVSIIGTLQAEGIEESIVVGFNVALESTKHVRNSDFIAEIAPKGSVVDVSISTAKQIKLSEDKGAQPVFISSEEFYKLYPLTYPELRNKCKTRYRDFMADNEYNKHIRDVKSKPQYAGTLGKNPKSRSKASPAYCYSEKCFEYLDQFYEVNKTED